jgi:hypothetical protein
VNRQIPLCLAVQRMNLSGLVERVGGPAVDVIDVSLVTPPGG